MNNRPERTEGWADCRLTVFPILPGKYLRVPAPRQVLELWVSEHAGEREPWLSEPARPHT